MSLIKYKTRNYYVDLLKLKTSREGGDKFSIPLDIAKALDIGNSTEFSGADVEAILKMVCFYFLFYLVMKPNLKKSNRVRADRSTLPGFTFSSSFESVKKPLIARRLSFSMKLN